MIRIEKLNKYYHRHKRNENHVLRNLSLTLPDRGLVAIFGRSGCGKTTLIKLIAGMLTPTQGRITYGGEELGKLSPDELMNVVAENLDADKNLLKVDST